MAFNMRVPRETLSSSLCAAVRLLQVCFTPCGPAESILPSLLRRSAVSSAPATHPNLLHISERGSLANCSLSIADVHRFVWDQPLHNLCLTFGQSSSSSSRSWQQQQQRQYIATAANVGTESPAVAAATGETSNALAGANDAEARALTRQIRVADLQQLQQIIRQSSGSFNAITTAAALFKTSALWSQAAAAAAGQAAGRMAAAGATSETHPEGNSSPVSTSQAQSLPDASTAVAAIVQQLVPIWFRVQGEAGGRELANVLKACSALHVFTTSSSTDPFNCGSSSSSSSGGEGSSSSSPVAGSCLQEHEQRQLWGSTLAALLQHPQDLNAVDAMQTIRALAELPTMDGSSSSRCVPGLSAWQVEGAVRQLVRMLIQVLTQQQQQPQQQQQQGQEGKQQQQLEWSKQITSLLGNLALLGNVPAPADLHFLLEVQCDNVAQLEDPDAAWAITSTLLSLSELQLHSPHWKMQQEHLELLLQPQLLNKLVAGRPPALAFALFSLAKLASVEHHQVDVPFVQDCAVQILAPVTPQQLARWRGTDLSHAMWACAKIGVKNTRFLQAASAALLQEGSLLGVLQLKQIAWAASKLHLKLSNSHHLVEMLLQQSKKVLHLSSGSSSIDSHQYSSSSSSGGGGGGGGSQQNNSSSTASTLRLVMQQQPQVVQQQHNLPQTDRAYLAVAVSFAAAVLNVAQLSGEVKELIYLSGLRKQQELLTATEARMLWRIHSWLLKEHTGGHGLTMLLTDQQLRMCAAASRHSARITPRTLPLHAAAQASLKGFSSSRSSNGNNGDHASSNSGGSSSSSRITPR